MIRPSGRYLIEPAAGGSRVTLNPHPDARGTGKVIAPLVGMMIKRLNQKPPSMPNAVLVAIQGEAADAFDVAAATRGLQARAGAGDDDFFRTRAFKSVRDFNLRYRRLGGVLVWCEPATGAARAAVWSNPSARIALPERALRACLLCLRAG